MKQKQNKLVLKLKNLFNPSAFKIGLILSFAFAYLSVIFYEQKDSLHEQSNFALKILNQIHQKSIDFRLIARGERKGSEQVAVLAVDEKAIENLGRWPWPRNMIATVIDNAVENGAKVIGFDIIFAEHDQNQAVRSLEKLKSTFPNNSELLNFAEQELQSANSDISLKQSIEKHADKLVMGMYFDMPEYYLGPANELCADLIYKKSKAFAFLESDAYPVVALDNASKELDAKTISFLEEKLELISQTQIQNNQSKKEALSQQVLNKKIWDEQHLFCAKWLSQSDDSLKEYKSLIQDQNYIDELYYGSLKNTIVRTGRLWQNIDDFNEVTQSSAYFNAFLDKDGSIRRSSLVARYGNQYIASLALKSVLMARSQNLMIQIDNDPIDPQQKIITKMSLLDSETGDELGRIPVDSQGNLSINFAGPQKMFPHISAYEFFHNKEDVEIKLRENGIEKTKVVKRKEWFKDKIFIIGATATGVYDLRVTPFEENFPGVETHVNIIDNLLRQDFLVNLPDEKIYMSLGILILGLLLSYAISKLSSVPGLLLSSGLLFSIYYLDKNFLFQKGFVIAIVIPLFLVATQYVFLTFFKYFTEEKTKRELKGTFQKYVSPAIVDEILSDAKNIELGGRKMQLSVLFSDVRGFTTISEKLDPKQLGDFLNSYLTPMTDLVFANKGTLDKYMGDAVMAFFGAPIAYPEHPQMACRCALQMLVKLSELQKNWAEQNMPPIDIGIGINTGEMSVGNMGSETVRSYTVMGDSVNLGSRLEGINKEYGTRIIISQFTYELVKNEFLCREIDQVKVKGKNLPVKIYELMAELNTVEANKLSSLAKDFSIAYKDYMQADFVQALTGFEKCLEQNKNDGPCALYIERCQEYIQSPPAKDWDGVFTMKTK